MMSEIATDCGLSVDILVFATMLASCCERYKLIFRRHRVGTREVASLDGSGKVDVLTLRDAEDNNLASTINGVPSHLFKRLSRDVYDLVQKGRGDLVGEVVDYDPNDPVQAFLLNKTCHDRNFLDQMDKALASKMREDKIARATQEERDRQQKERQEREDARREYCAMLNRIHGTDMDGIDAGLSGHTIDGCKIF